jgi:hypothetical protein
MGQIPAPSAASASLARAIAAATNPVLPLSQIAINDGRPNWICASIDAADVGTFVFAGDAPGVLTSADLYKPFWVEDLREVWMLTNITTRECVRLWPQESLGQSLATQILRSPLFSAALTPTTLYTYYTYLGEISRPVLSTQTTRLIALCSGVASGVTTCELGLFSGSVPNQANQTLTYIGSGSVDPTATGIKAADLSVAIAPRTHLWGALRINATGAGGFRGVAFDCGEGSTAVETASAALSAATNRTGTVSAAWNTAATAADIRLRVF